ncbi:amino acid ABC transporter permease [Leptothoe spongobia]|uniref:Amino acid ABC transporter permease n=1 Tax=Leptothoe spongobia TAU-MAC 1115 TaxID=1967444 RepID=A0A947DI89_9CYAN|nr:ABC transporter permease subunit [Leptothoe spongobia]MBT9317010.1 amino acid ABC transporter permease [Leptothoe spongobia TAU-MAC 1115]
MQYILDALPTLLQGAAITLQLTALAIFFGFIGGTLLGTARLSKIKPVRLVTQAYIEFFRGTPLLVQIFWIYFGFPPLFQSLGLDFTFDRWAAGVLALSLNAAAYIAEIVRGGIQSIERGQWEAASSMGLNSLQTLRYIVLPQALRRMIPPLGNEFTTLLKDTSLVAVIGLEELFRRGQLIVATNFRAFEIYTAVGLIYLAMNLFFSQGFTWLEKWTDPTEKAKRGAQKTVTPAS